MVLATVLEIICDQAMKRPARPLHECIAMPGLPIRENYMNRLVINLTWFARNYINLMLVATLVVLYWYPGFLITMLLTVNLHRTKAGSGARKALSLLQLATSAFNTWYWGFLPGFVFCTALVVVICGHAVLTPYTDEASTWYTQCMREAQVDDTFARPRTPVMSFEGETYKDSDPPPRPPSMSGLDELDRQDSSMFKKGNTAAGLRRRAGIGTVVRRKDDVLGSQTSLASSLPEALNGPLLRTRRTTLPRASCDSSSAVDQSTADSIAAERSANDMSPDFAET